MRGRGVGYGRAVGVSVVVHALLVAMAYLVIGSRPPAPPPAGPAGIDARTLPPVGTQPEPERRIRLPANMPSKSPPKPPPTPSPPTGSRPEVPHIPGTLPAEWVARIRTPRATPTTDVVQVAVVATPLKPGSTPGAVQPAGGVGEQPVHGPLKPDQAVVYVLDCSGSMGAAGKFARARAAILATLREQPETVRVQVVVYDSAAVVLVPGGWLRATAANVERISAAIAALHDPAGRSNHAEGLRAALMLRPDIVLIFTDADDFQADHLRGVLAGAAKPATVCVAKVSADGIAAPTRLK